MSEQLEGSLVVAQLDKLVGRKVEHIHKGVAASAEVPRYLGVGGQGVPGQEGGFEVGGQLGAEGLEHGLVV